MAHIAKATDPQPILASVGSVASNDQRVRELLGTGNAAVSALRMDGHELEHELETITYRELSIEKKPE